MVAEPNGGHTVQLPTIKRWYLWIFLPILLGAVGSGTWDYLLEPALTRGSAILLNILTFGTSALSDSIYRDIARGHHEAPSLATQAMGLGIVLAIVSMVSIEYYFGIERRLRLRFAGLDRAERRRRMKRPMAVITTINLFACGYVVMDLSRHAYVNNAITHYEHVFQIVAPLLTDEKEQQINSQFGQIQSKQDYDAVTINLERLADSAGFDHPDLSVWW